MPIAFKEWAVTVRALAEGEQLVTLRKGGIREPDKHFALEHERFFLYPTFDHQRRDLVRESHQPELRRALEEGVWADGEPPAARADARRRRSAQPDRVRIRAWAEVAASWTVTDRRAVDALSPFYVWTPDYAEKRLAWKRRHPLHVLLLRTYRIPRPVTVKVRDEYGGCRSWLEITRDLPFEGTPVLSDEEFERASEEIAGDRRVRPASRALVVRSAGPRAWSAGGSAPSPLRRSVAGTAALTNSDAEMPGSRRRRRPSRARHDERDVDDARACSPSSSTLARDSDACLPERVGELASCSTARRRSSTLPQPWLPLQRRLTAPAGRAATSSAGPAERELHVLAPRLLARARLRTCEGSLEMLMLAPSRALARRVIVGRQPPGPAAALRAAAFATLAALGVAASRARRSYFSGQVRARPAGRRAAPARGRPAVVPAGPARRAAARRHGVRPARARGGRPRRARRWPAARTATDRAARCARRSAAGRRATPQAAWRSSTSRASPAAATSA